MAFEPGAPSPEPEATAPTSSSDPVSPSMGGETDFVLDLGEPTSTTSWSEPPAASASFRPAPDPDALTGPQITDAQSVGAGYAAAWLAGPDRLEKVWPFYAGMFGFTWVGIVVALLSLTGVLRLNLPQTTELAEVLSPGLVMLPVVLLALLAYLGRTRDWALVLTGLWLPAVVLPIAGFPVFSLLGIMTAQAAAASGSGNGPSLPGVAHLPPVPPVQVLSTAAWSALAIVLSVMVLFPAVRRRLAARIPIDADSPVHACALSLTLGSAVALFGQLCATGGRPIMLGLLAGESQSPAGMGAAAQIGSAVWMVAGAALACGYPLVRDWRETLARLGLVKPTRNQVLLALGLAVVMVGFGLLLDQTIGRVWEFMRWPTTDQKTFEKVLAPLLTPMGAVVIGVTAGVGEEAVIRGALQPRLGILLPNLFFTCLHAPQYGFDGLLSVFIVGMLLGVVRNRTNTTTSCILHGTYDFILIMITVIQGSHH